MRFTFAVLSLSLLPSIPAAAQVDDAPPGLSRVELDRSRACVGILERLDGLDRTLEPLATRSRRLAAISEAVALEDRSRVQPFDAANELEVRVRDWFQLDAGLAQRYVNNPTPSLAAERNAGRETIKAAVAQAIADVQAQANAMLEANRELVALAGPCDGAIFVRSAVLEACRSASGEICTQAAKPASEVTGYRFVDDPLNVWDIQEMRPWTTPRPLRPGQGGQLDGARTIGYARVGNVVVSVAFTALLREIAQVPEENLARYRAINDSLGLSFTHPDLAFAPALSVRAALPEALAGERRYVLHFGAPEAAEVVWSGPASTGAALEATIPFAAGHVQRLRGGQPLSLTALVETAEGTEAPAYTIALGNVSQGPAVDALLRYMSSQLSADLTALVPPRGAR